MSPVFIAVINVSVMVEMGLSGSYISFQFSVHMDGGNGIEYLSPLFSKCQIRLRQGNFTKYDFDKCKRKNRIDYFL